ncbi:hypothetical protein ACKS2F_003106 [Cronobacter dublinensis]
MANGTMSPLLYISFRADGGNRAVGKRSASTRRDIPFIKRHIAKPYSPRCAPSLFFISDFIAHLCRIAAPSRIPFLLKNAVPHK